MSTTGLSKENVEKLLAGGDADVEIEAEETAGFNFKQFVTDNSKMKMTFNNGFTILRNRAAIYKMVKAGHFKFQGKSIVVPSSTSSPGQDDWTFRRLEGFIRAKMFMELINMENAVEQQKMYEKLCELPMVNAYGLKPSSKFDPTTARVVLTLGGPLPLMASLDKFAAAAFPLAYFQNVKKEALGINKFSTYEQLCKIARVMATKEFTFTGASKAIFEETIKILNDCTPGTAGAASLNKFNEQIKALEAVFGKIVDDNNAGSSKPRPASKKNQGF
ncbi:nucleocapsid [Orthotospovirus polygonianuli]|uniref:Nucleoprotein n=2 Tax=Orthotospovirus polygonianuli TaxID=3052582 RepID=A4GW61_9VIRU|nr:nucleocapsid [Orthotospovirus polygonianuli]ABO31117.1 nucleocapsid protein [Orthotospovirus polygonianuli]AHZ45961.1 nucleocapsid [Orthotospovirus polygonianuli]AOO95318.1 N [Polygonum ringspot virus] [Polygonum ringspot virus]